MRLFLLILTDLLTKLLVSLFFSKYIPLLSLIDDFINFPKIVPLFLLLLGNI